MDVNLLISVTSGAIALASVIFTYAQMRTAREALTDSREATQISRGASEISREALAVAREANALAEEGLAVAKVTHARESFPILEFSVTELSSITRSEPGWLSMQDRD